MQKALADAEECIQINSSWDKGYFRKANILEATKQYDQVSNSITLPVHMLIFHTLHMLALSAGKSESCNEDLWPINAQADLQLDFSSACTA